MEYATLREANIARQVEWLDGKTLPLTFRTNEMAGEAGEVAELLLDRWRPGSHMYSAWRDALANEMADVVICGDLVLYYAGETVDLDSLDGRAHSIATDGKWATYVLREMGLACNAAKKADRSLYGIAGGVSLSEVDVVNPIRRVMQAVYDLAYNEHMIMEVALARKFNRTSKKMGLQTLFIPPGYDRALLIP